MPALIFEIHHLDPGSSARLGRITTPHGVLETPGFVPVGTQATIKGLLPHQVADLGAQAIFANTYHLLLRPGPELVEQMGGLHHWMGWDQPILTDSGGYQIFSLAQISHINDEGVRFRSHLDGSTVELTPRRAMEVQNQLGADIIMALDDCPPLDRSGIDEKGSRLDQNPGPDTRIHLATQRTVRWLEQCVQSHQRQSDQALFGIVQGGTNLDQRSWCVARITQHDLPGFAIGGVAVGEGHALIKKVVEHTAPQLPAEKPRHLLGVGYERDILAAVHAGVDTFDCVLPTRNGRNASAFTRSGPIRLRNSIYKDDPQVIESGCDCPTCSGGFSRSYIRHLFLASEMLGPILVSLHNLRHFQRFLLDIRRAIAHNAWSELAERWPVAFEAN